MTSLTILFSKDRSGVTFALASCSRQYEKCPRVFLAFDDEFKFENISSVRLGAVVQILTGLDSYTASFVDAVTDHPYFTVTSP